jgi:hypothetical protein
MRFFAYILSISVLIYAGLTAAVLLANHKIANLVSLAAALVAIWSLINVLRNRILGVTCCKCGSLFVIESSDKVIDATCKNCKMDYTDDDE